MELAGILAISIRRSLAQLQLYVSRGIYGATSEALFKKEKNEDIN